MIRPPAKSALRHVLTVQRVGVAIYVVIFIALVTAAHLDVPGVQWRLDALEHMELEGLLDDPRDFYRSSVDFASATAAAISVAVFQSVAILFALPRRYFTFLEATSRRRPARRGDGADDAGSTLSSGPTSSRGEAPGSYFVDVGDAGPDDAAAASGEDDVSELASISWSAGGDAKRGGGGGGGNAAREHGWASASASGSTSGAGRQVPSNGSGGEQPGTLGRPDTAGGKAVQRANLRAGLDILQLIGVLAILDRVLYAFDWVPVLQASKAMGSSYVVLGPVCVLAIAEVAGVMLASTALTGTTSPLPRRVRVGVPALIALGYAALPLQRLFSAHLPVQIISSLLFGVGELCGSAIVVVGLATLRADFAGLRATYPALCAIFSPAYVMFGRDLRSTTAPERSSAAPPTAPVPGTPTSAFSEDEGGGTRDSLSSATREALAGLPLCAVIDIARRVTLIRVRALATAVAGFAVLFNAAHIVVFVIDVPPRVNSTVDCIALILKTTTLPSLIVHSWILLHHDLATFTQRMRRQIAAQDQAHLHQAVLHYVCTEALVPILSLMQGVRGLSDAVNQLGGSSDGSVSPPKGPRPVSMAGSGPAPTDTDASSLRTQSMDWGAASQAYDLLDAIQRGTGPSSATVVRAETTAAAGGSGNWQGRPESSDRRATVSGGALLQSGPGTGPGADADDGEQKASGLGREHVANADAKGRADADSAAPLDTVIASSPHSASAGSWAMAPPPPHAPPGPEPGPRPSGALDPTLAAGATAHTPRDGPGAFAIDFRHPSTSSLTASATVDPRAPSRGSGHLPPGHLASGGGWGLSVRSGAGPAQSVASTVTDGFSVNVPSVLNRAAGAGTAASVGEWSISFRQPSGVAHRALVSAVHDQATKTLLTASLALETLRCTLSEAQRIRRLTPASVVVDRSIHPIGAVFETLLGAFHQKAADHDIVLVLCSADDALSDPARLAAAAKLSHGRKSPTGAAERKRSPARSPRGPRGIRGPASRVHTTGYGGPAGQSRFPDAAVAAGSTAVTAPPTPHPGDGARQGGCGIVPAWVVAALSTSAMRAVDAGRAMSVGAETKRSRAETHLARVLSTRAAFDSRRLMQILSTVISTAMRHFVRPEDDGWTRTSQRGLVSVSVSLHPRSPSANAPVARGEVTGGAAPVTRAATDLHSPDGSAFLRVAVADDGLPTTPQRIAALRTAYARLRRGYRRSTAAGHGGASPGGSPPPPSRNAVGPGSRRRAKTTVLELMSLPTPFAGAAKEGAGHGLRAGGGDSDRRVRIAESLACMMVLAHGGRTGWESPITPGGSGTVWWFEIPVNCLPSGP